jgi:hypothetical protein
VVEEFHQKRVQERLGTEEPTLLGLVDLVEPSQTALEPYLVPAEQVV